MSAGAYTQIIANKRDRERNFTFNDALYYSGHTSWMIDK